MLLKILCAIVLGAFVGSLTGKTASIYGVSFYELFELFSQLFLNSLTLLAIPIVASAIISGLGQLSSQNSFAKLGKKTFLFYILTISAAVVVGITMYNVFDPAAKYIASEHTIAPTERQNSYSFNSSASKSIYQILTKLVPPNVVEAASTGNMIGVIFFSVLFGFALMNLKGPLQQSMLNFWKAFFETLMKVTQMLMKTLPYGVFFLMAKVTASQGLQSFGALGWFFLTIFLGLFTFCFLLIPAVLKILGISPIKYLRAISPALITAFSTGSSAATLPVTLDCVEKRAGVSAKICGFVIPLGLSMNMAGSALYECVAVLFIAQVYGVSLTVGHQLLVAILALITSMGVGGIPSGSIVGVMIILQSLGLPPEGVALILPLDRILDMCRTTVNVYSDASCAVLIAHSEGEEILKERKKALNPL